MPEDLAIAVEEPIESEVVETGAETEVETPETEGHEQEKPELTQTPGSKKAEKLETIVKSNLEKLKAIHPSLAGQVRDLIGLKDRLTTEFPGGLKEAISVRDAYSALGGAEGVKEYQEALQDYGQLEQWFEGGDRQFIDRLAGEAPESFSLMMPAGLEQWKKIDPEFYNHTMAKVMTDTMTQVNALGIIEAAWEGAEAGKVKDALAYLWQQLNGFKDLSSKAVDRKPVTSNKPDERENSLRERELKVLMAPVTQAGDTLIRSTTEREISKDFQWDQTDPDVKEEVLAKVRDLLGKRLSKIGAFTGPRDRMKQAGNIEGLKRHNQTWFGKTIPDIISKVAKLYNLKPRSAAKKTVESAKPGAVAKAEPGWVKVSAPPNPRDVDRSKTTPDMVFDNKAILKDGRKIFWPS